MSDAKSGFKLPGLTERMSIIVLVVIILFIAGPGIYFFIKYRTSQSISADSQAAIDAETSQLTAKVGKLMLLPIGENPTVATVSDVSKLKDQTFFTNAENGDKVLIYQASKKAILYRPGENRIIEVAPVNIGPASTSPSPEASVSATVTGTAKGTPTAKPSVKPAAARFILLNGTGVVGLTRKFEPTLKAKIPTSTVLDRDNAKKQDYTSSVIVDITKTRTAEVADIAAKLNLTVSTLPVGEVAPAEGEYLIILGSDYASTPSATPAD